MSSQLLFADPTALHQASVAVGASWGLSEKVTFTISLGELTGGWVQARGRALSALAPAPIAGVSVALPFATLTFSASSLTTHTSAGDLTSTFGALDFRAAGIIGYTFAHRFSVYTAVVFFGGPVFWSDESDVAGDAYHYQVMLGVSVALPAHFDLFVEGSPVGEKALSAGIGYAF